MSDPTGQLPFLGLVRDAERQFLSGRRPRADELESAVRYFLEFLRGFESLDFDGPCVTVFGSARFDRGSSLLRDGPRVLRRRALAEAGFTS